MENVATLLVPPTSTLSEIEWLSAIVSEGEGGMLLDLHNLHANAWNFGGDTVRMLDGLPLDKVRQIHLSGGVMIPAPGRAQRLLDDHVHDVADACYMLLEELAARVAQPLMVIVERDGRYPPMATLVEQLHEARQALRRGRLRRALAQNGGVMNGCAAQGGEHVRH